MAEIYPFKGIRYNQKKIGNLALVVTPPYDVISPEDRLRYYKRHKYNVIRLILGREFPKGDKSNNTYTRAASLFATWLREGILLEEDEPSIYIYEQEYTFSGRPKNRRGFVALLRLEEWESKVVFPHEETFPQPREDRLKLLKACQANFDQIVVLYADPKRTIAQTIREITDQRSPSIQFSGEGGMRQRMWRIMEKDLIKRFKKEMEDKWLVVADGHHRYEAALNFCREMRERFSSPAEREAYNYILAFFEDMDDPGLIILPIQRLIKHLPRLSLENLEEKLSRYFEVESWDINEILNFLAKQRFPNVFGLYLRPDFTTFKGFKGSYLLTLKEEKVPEDIVSSLRAKEWRRAGTTVLHFLLLRHILKVEDEESIAYERDADKAISLVNEGKYEAACLLNPPTVREVIDLARVSERMLPKSTYFYPKVYSGLVMSKLSGKVGM